MFTTSRLVEEAKQVVKLSSANNLQITQSGATVSTVKRVAFVLDYSGSMSGTKIRTAIENINSIVTDHIQELDSVMIIHFNERIHVDVPLCQKLDQEPRLRSIISGESMEMRC
jgi:Mg-chelatase subunit ChlD